MRRKAEDFSLVYSRQFNVNFKLCRVMFWMLLATALYSYYLQSEVVEKN